MDSPLPHTPVQTPPHGVTLAGLWGFRNQGMWSISYQCVFFPKFIFGVRELALLVTIDCLIGLFVQAYVTLHVQCMYTTDPGKLIWISIWISSVHTRPPKPPLLLLW